MVFVYSIYMPRSYISTNVSQIFIVSSPPFAQSFVQTADIPMNLSSLLSTTQEFLTIWLEQILYYHQIYPPETFDKVKLFEIGIYRNRNPSVREFLDKLAANLVDNFQSLKKIICVIETPLGTLITSYVVEVANVITPFPQGPTAIEIDGFGWGEIYTQLNLVLTTHITHLRAVSPIPCKFAIEVDLSLGLVTREWTRVKQSSPSNILPTGQVALKLWEFDVYHHS